MKLKGTYEIKMWKCSHPMCGHLNETFINPNKCCRCGEPKPVKAETSPVEDTTPRKEGK